MKAIIMQGVSGAGKSRYLKEHYPNAKVCSSDHFFMKNGGYKFDYTKLAEAQGNCLQRFVVGLMIQDEGETLAVDNTNTTALEMAPYVAVAQAWKVDVHIIRVACSLEEALHRASTGEHKIPEETIRKQFARLEQFVLPKWWPAIEYA